MQRGKNECPAGIVKQHQSLVVDAAGDPDVLRRDIEAPAKAGQPIMLFLA